jgi:hypothetical protein
MSLMYFIHQFTDSNFFFIGSIIFFILYFLPSVIAFFRRKKNALAIFILNLFLGFTFIGWVIALIWAVLYEEKNDVES